MNSGRKINATMTLFSKHIRLNEDFEISALNNRATARKLVEKIKKSWARSVVLDFDEIVFASRSFMDELNSHLPHLNKEVKKANMNPTVKEMDKLVQRKRSVRVNYSSTEGSEPEMITF